MKTFFKLFSVTLIVLTILCSFVAADLTWIVSQKEDIISSKIGLLFFTFVLSILWTAFELDKESNNL